MNKAKAKKLAKINAQITEMLETVQIILDEEEEALYEIEDTDCARYEHLNERVGSLEDVITNLECAQGSIEIITEEYDL